MLKLSKKAEYALMAAKYMALKNSSGFSTAKEISESYQIPYQLVAKVLQNLVKSDIAVSAKGVNGGFSLARKANTISLIDIIRAVETNFKIVDCMQANSSSADCEHFDCCKIKDPLAEVQRKIDKVFNETTIANIL
ncbi:MAG TPA: Rrf2 family transcriptional regulator [Ignavibacteriaceae bacterium]